MTAPPDRLTLLASQHAWAHSQQAPEYVPQDTRTHQEETRVAHQSTTVDGTPASGEGHGPWPRRPI